MSRPHKFRKGGRIKTIGHAAEIICRGGWVYWGSRPKHPGWMASMHLNVIDAAVRRGWLHRAVPSYEKEDD